MTRAATTLCLLFSCLHFCSIPLVAQTFSSRIQITTSANEARVAYPADFDGDGDLDVLSGSSGDDTIEWHRNGDQSGDGTGTSWTTIKISITTDGADSVYGADIDGDGDIDALSSSAYDNTVAWYRNGDANGGGDGTEWTTINIDLNADLANTVAATDIDQDGDLDVLVASRQDDTVAWHQNGDASGGGNGTNWTKHIITASADFVTRAHPADIDGDGDIDVISGSRDDDTIALHRNGDTQGGGDGSSWTRIPIDTSIDGPRYVYTGDIDSDGDLDVLSTSQYDDKVAWYRNGDETGNGDGSTWTTIVIPATAEDPAEVFPADVDEDGDVDVLVASGGENPIALLQNGGDASGGGDGITWSEQGLDISGQFGTSVYATDLDGDTDLDVLSTSRDDNTVGWHPNERTTIPVELASFTAQLEGKQAILQWDTVSETKNAGFSVERKAADALGWSELGFVDGVGTTTQVQSYRFTDAALPYDANSLQYRLRQVDINGTSEVVGTQTLTRGSLDEMELQIPSPNPATSQVTARVGIPSEAANVRLELYDVLGRKVRTRTVTGSGRHEIVLRTENLAAGTYFLRLVSNQHTRTQKLTVLQ
jgi:hypothetical protein